MQVFCKNFKYNLSKSSFLKLGNAKTFWLGSSEKLKVLTLKYHLCTVIYCRITCSQGLIDAFIHEH